MRYEFGQFRDYDETENCSGTQRQLFRPKDCLNKFQADVECNGQTVSWRMGQGFGEPNFVIPTAKSRVFSRFIGWKTINWDAALANCSFPRQFNIWVYPKGKEHLLDNLLAVYRADSSDYSHLDTQETH
eukprot:Gregarina_sp_Pseudo_9__2087@NODE_2451_length_991_cov_34_995798_g2254_i0_p1_GENE_NODE_2451_length_991_cov_34_995798_g2254_i0NODE_2451_length_991_cov_34_995798_g2254_i0_p1_ORF_typecomplete_len129_score12_24_NODE_2451_length_991_cov_34_995798_g2254_i0210596